MRKRSSAESLTPQVRGQERSGRTHELRLLAFDVEGTLTGFPTIWELMHRKMGTWESHGKEYWIRYQRGELDYDEFARMDVACWRGAPVSFLEEAAEEVPLMPGAIELLRAAMSAKIGVAFISNGLDILCARLARKTSFAHIRANHAIVADGRLTGELEIRVPYHEKGSALRRIMREQGLLRRDVAAIGDSLADVAMFHCASISIAVKPSDEAVAKGATYIIGHDLREALPLLFQGNVANHAAGT